MTARQYVDVISKLVITTSDSGFSDYNESQLQMINKSFLLNPRDSLSFSQDLGDELRNLIANYNTDSYLAGHFSFMSEIMSDAEYHYWGDTAYSLLAIDKSTGILVEIDSEERVVLNYIAGNARLFLDALTMYLTLYSQRLKGHSNRDDQSMNEKYIATCAEAAGGIKFENFYRQLIN